MVVDGHLSSKFPLLLRTLVGTTRVSLYHRLIRNGPILPQYAVREHLRLGPCPNLPKDVSRIVPLYLELRGFRDNSNQNRYTEVFEIVKTACRAVPKHPMLRFIGRDLLDAQ